MTPDGSIAFIPASIRETEFVDKMNDLLSVAARTGAADLHFESDRDRNVVVRMRNKDGDLENVHVFNSKDAALVFNKVRYRANMSTVDTRAAQDSRITQAVDGRILSIRVSIVPTVNGTSCVMRLLDPNNAGRPLETLMMPPRVDRAFRHAINSPEGLVITVGPTGSGKTSTLYTALALRNDSTVKIVTAEDPVEYLLAGAQQVEVGENRGITFPLAMRAFLRQDPDIILVGEIRDNDTLSTALQAGQTGHLVLSTLHANNTIEAIERMIELGARPQTLRSALRAILAQRLVRKVCAACAKPHPIVDIEAVDIIAGTGIEVHTEMFGEGCAACNHTGYSGRQAIYEMLLLDKQARLALTHVDISAIEAAAVKQPQFSKLLNSAILLVVSGVTNMKEVKRVVAEL